MTSITKPHIFSANGHRVSARSRSDIRKLAQKFRDIFLPKDRHYFPIERILDLLADMGVCEYEIRDKKEMPRSTHAYTCPDKGLIVLSEDVYDGACNGNGQDRFTIAHEFGHLVLHKGQTKLARSLPLPARSHKPFEDSEWQANQFAAEVLMDSRNISTDHTALQISKLCGVSHKAAINRLGVLNKAKER